MRYRAALFDLDDTLLKTYVPKWAQHKTAAKQFYGIDLSDEVLRRHWGEPTHILVGHLYNNADTMENMVASFRSLDGYFPKQIQDETLSVLERLALAGLPLGIVTNMQRKSAMADMGRLGLRADLFHTIQTFDDTQTYKPDPRVFVPTLQALNLYDTRSDVVYIGDGLIDFYAARDFGLQFIGVTTGVTNRGDLKKAGAEDVIKTLSELPALLL